MCQIKPHGALVHRPGPVTSSGRQKIGGSCRNFEIYWNHFTQVIKKCSRNFEKIIDFLQGALEKLRGSFELVIFFRKMDFFVNCILHRNRMRVYNYLLTFPFLNCCFFVTEREKGLRRNSYWKWSYLHRPNLQGS